MGGGRRDSFQGSFQEKKTPSNTNPLHPALQKLQLSFAHVRCKFFESNLSAAPAFAHLLLHELEAGQHGDVEFGVGVHGALPDTPREVLELRIIWVIGEMFGVDSWFGMGGENGGATGGVIRGG